MNYTYNNLNDRSVKQDMDHKCNLQCLALITYEEVFLNILSNIW